MSVRLAVGPDRRDEAGAETLGNHQVVLSAPQTRTAFLLKVQTSCRSCGARNLTAQYLRLAFRRYEFLDSRQGHFNPLRVTAWSSEIISRGNSGNVMQIKSGCLSSTREVLRGAFEALRPQLPLYALQGTDLN